MTACSFSKDAALPNDNIWAQTCRESLSLHTDNNMTMFKHRAARPGQLTGRLMTVLIKYAVRAVLYYVKAYHNSSEAVELEQCDLFTH